MKATVVKSNQAIRIRSRKEFVDREGRARVTGEEWMVKKTGAYLPGAYEEVAEIVNAYVLTEKVVDLLCLHSLSQHSFIKISVCIRKFF